MSGLYDRLLSKYYCTIRRFRARFSVDWETLRNGSNSNRIAKYMCIDLPLAHPHSRPSRSCFDNQSMVHRWELSSHHMAHLFSIAIPPVANMPTELASPLLKRAHANGKPRRCCCDCNTNQPTAPHVWHYSFKSRKFGSVLVVTVGGVVSAKGWHKPNLYNIQVRFYYQAPDTKQTNRSCGSYIMYGVCKHIAATVALCRWHNMLALFVCVFIWFRLEVLRSESVTFVRDNETDRSVDFECVH